MADTKFLINTDQNIQKQYINIQTTLSLPGDFSYHSYDFAHNLGYIPSARAWFEPEAGKWYPMAIIQLQDGSTGNFLRVTGVLTLSTVNATLSMVNFTSSTRNVNIIIRVYLDD